MSSVAWLPLAVESAPFVPDSCQMTSRAVGAMLQNLSLLPQPCSLSLGCLPRLAGAFQYPLGGFRSGASAHSCVG
jgi:hypothetical protein